MEGRKVLLGGGHAPWAFLLLDTIRQLRDMGIDVEVCLAPDVLRWTTPAPFWALVGDRVWTDGLALAASLERGASIDADGLAVVGATPDLVARLARGIPEDAVTVAALSFDGPSLLVPVTDPRLRERPGFQKNLRLLDERGWSGIEPVDRPGAPRTEPCPDDVVSGLVRLLLERSPGCPILVTAGPTREPIDPVRYISNYSSGRMRYAVARAARDMGHPVTLVSGPVEGFSPPPGVETIRVTTALEMLEALRRCHHEFPVLVMVAAVADYRAREVSSRKIRRDRPTRHLELISNPDILASLQHERRGLVSVGFAIEGGLDEAALQGVQEKIASKGVTFLVLNDPGRADSAFGGGTVRSRIIWNPAEAVERHVEDFPVLPKEELGREIIRRAVGVLLRRRRETRRTLPAAGG